MGGVVLFPVGSVRHHFIYETALAVHHLGWISIQKLIEIQT